MTDNRPTTECFEGHYGTPGRCPYGTKRCTEHLERPPRERKSWHVLGPMAFCWLLFGVGAALVVATLPTLIVVGVVVGVLLGDSERRERAPVIDPEAARLKFLLAPIPLVKSIWDDDTWFGQLEDMWPDSTDKMMLCDYLDGVLSIDGFTEFLRTPPVVIDVTHDMSYEGAVTTCKGVPLKEWNCAERGHVLLSYRMGTHTSAAMRRCRYQCRACDVDLSDQSVYGSELYESA